MTNTNRHVSAAQILETLELYFELQSSDLAGAKLGISSAAVRSRLAPYGVVPREQCRWPKSLEAMNDMNRIRALKKYLKEKAEWKRNNPFVVRKNAAVPAVELLSTVALYLQLNSTLKVGAVMGISHRAVQQRLKGLGIILVPPNKRDSKALDCNEAATIEKIMKQLHDQAEVEIYQAQ